MKKIVIVLLNLLIILSSMLLAQNPPDTLWTRTFGGSSTDIANSVIKTSDGGYIMAGKKHVSGGPGGNFDWYVVKTDEIGNYMWSKTYGEEEDDIAYYIDQTNDDGYIITGRFCAYARLIKTDNNGNEEWNKIFNGDGEWDASQSYCVQQTTDGGYILTGWYDDFGWWHLWLAKTDSLGDVIWLNNYWEPYDCEWGYSVQQTSDSGFILAGRNHAQDYCIIKTNNSGGVEWENHYCGTSYVDFPQSIKETNDNGYIVTGYYNDTDVNESILACKLDGNGNILWSEIYGGAESDKAYSIVNAHNGGYVMVGETESYSGNQHSDIWIIKIDENGNIVWDKTIGGSYWDYGRSIQKTSYGYILAGAKTFYGTTYEDFYLVYLEAESNIINIPDDHPTIQEGIDASVNGDTVLVQPGTYVENINYNGKNITVASLFLTTQDTSYISQTIIDGNQNGSVVTFESGEDTSAVLTGFTITNGNTGYGGGIHCNDSSPSLKSLSIKDNFSSPRGGGIYCIESSPCLENITITDNSTDQGGGLYCRNNSNPILQNVSITGNTATNFGGGLLCRYNSNPSLYNVTIIGNSTLGAIGWGGGIYCTESSPSLVNVTITDNSAWHGGGIHCQYDCSPNLLNSILWDNTPEEIYFYHDGEPNTITISYSDIDGGSAGIVTNNNGTVYWLEGNIDADPLFADPENGDYHLSWDNFPIEDTTKSPCIDAGDPDPQYNDPDGTRNDMGAYYFDQTPYYFDISGNIGYFSDGDAVPNTILELTGDNNYSTTTDESGDYYLFEIYGGSYISTPSKTNDLEGLSGLDASRIARFSAGLYAFDCMQWIASDVSLNGSTSGLDASRVARYSIGTITELNPEGINWTFTPEPIPECDTWPPIVYENTREYS
ncbi:MAG: hypothetical protein H8D22_08050, partial [Candidatus Cloacimonetes bacterium]|nr:hypothetical protein [Candidatus Cloacimonadota bacterium]